MVIIGVIIANSACKQGSKPSIFFTKGEQIGQYYQRKVKLLIKFRKLWTLRSS